MSSSNNPLPFSRHRPYRHKNITKIVASSSKEGGAFSSVGREEETRGVIDDVNRLTAELFRRGKIYQSNTLESLSPSYNDRSDAHHYHHYHPSQAYTTTSIVENDVVDEDDKVGGEEEGPSSSGSKLLHPQVVDLWITLVVEPKIEVDQFNRKRTIILSPGFMDSKGVSVRAGENKLFYNPGVLTFLAPMLYLGHWVLAVIEYFGEMKISFCDVFNLPNKRENLFEPLVQWLKLQYIAEEHVSAEQANEILDFSFSHTVYSNRSAVYKNGDCGVFMCMAILYFSQERESLDFGPNDMLAARRFITRNLALKMLPMPQPH